MDHQDYKVVDIGNPKLKALRNQQKNKEIAIPPHFCNLAYLTKT